MNNIARCFIRNTQRSCGFRSWMVSTCRGYGTWEPDYLDIKPDIPEYGTLNIRMQGQDFPVLETYSKYVHNLVNRLNIPNDSYPVPPHSSKINVFKPWSSNVQHSYEFNMYERVVQIDNLPSTLAPLLFDVMYQHLPQGVTISVKEPDADEEEFRYVPDVMLMDLQSQVEGIEQIKADRRKK